MESIRSECLVRQLDTNRQNPKHAMQEEYHKCQKNINQSINRAINHADATRQIFPHHGIYITLPPFTILPGHFPRPGSADVEPAFQSPARSFCPSPC